MIGREVRTIRWHGGADGVVIRWEPLGAAMCDALIRFEDGREVWFSSRDLRPRGALECVPLPSRGEAQRMAKARALASLKALRAEMVRQVRGRVPWPGMEFGKGHLGQAIDLAIGDLEGGDLEGGDLEGGDLEGGDLEGGDLEGGPGLTAPLPRARESK